MSDTIDVLAGKRVVVTGGEGFIGRATCHVLRHLGADAVAADSVNGDFDVRDPRTCEYQVKGTWGVVHLAGVLGTHELFDTPRLATEVNVFGTENVLNACASHRARYVGITMPRVFPSVYTATRTIACAIEDQFAGTMPVSRVQAFNVFGPGQHHGAGHPQKIVPTFAVEAWAGRPLPIWGSGTQTVDLVWVNDVARMLVAGLVSPGSTFDAGSGASVSVLAVAKTINDITGNIAGVVHLPMRRGEVETDLCATGQGWDRLAAIGFDPPKYHPVDEMLQTIRAYEDHPAVSLPPAWTE